mmetsp:Transcript_52154/g.123492  ORF Transcript_52154/g.123492 Transcript_52154/m.123492 type:complete len:226 (+) Transcript_52154:367-1044(+)
MEVTMIRMRTELITGTREAMRELKMMRSDLSFRKRRTARKTRRRRMSFINGTCGKITEMTPRATTTKSKTFHPSSQKGHQRCPAMFHNSSTRNVHVKMSSSSVKITSWSLVSDGSGSSHSISSSPFVYAMYRSPASGRVGASWVSIALNRKFPRMRTPKNVWVIQWLYDSFIIDRNRIHGENSRNASFVISFATAFRMSVTHWSASRSVHLNIMFTSLFFSLVTK